MKFKAKDKVVYEADYIPNNQVMTITRGTHKSHGGINQVVKAWRYLVIYA